MGKLVLYMPDGSTREILLTRERIRIGRRPDNDIPLPFPAVSGEHAAIVTILSDSFLEDLGSTGEPGHHHSEQAQGCDELSHVSPPVTHAVATG